MATKSRLVVNQDEIVGFGNIDDRGYIDLFYISADYQRQGVGQQLLKDLEKVLRLLCLALILRLQQKLFWKNGLSRIKTESCLFERTRIY